MNSFWQSYYVSAVPGVHAPVGYRFSQLRPSAGLMVILFTVPESMQRAFTLNPSGSDLGT